MTEVMGDVRRRKLAKLFAVLDTNGDGAISEADYEAFGLRLAEVSGQQDATRIAEMKESFKTIWDEFQENADTDHDGRVSEDEFATSLLSPQAADPGRFSRFIGLTCNFLFGLADTDGTGRISRAEHVRIGTQVLGLSDAEATNSFEKLDFWHNGHLTMDAYIIGYTEFLTSTSESADGNSLFGNY